MKPLVEKLKKCKSVSKFDTTDEPEAWRIVNSLSDLEEAFEEVTRVLLPRLVNTESINEAEDTLHDIGEELRHILYHIKDPKYFSYLLEKGDQ